MAITTNTSFDDRIEQPGTDPILLVEIAGNTDWYFSTRRLLAGAGAGYDDYDPIIKNDPVLTMEFPSEGFGRAIVSDVEVTILNADKKSNAIQSSLSYAENAAVIIKFGFAKDNYGNDFLLDNFVTVFTGVVEDYSWNNETLTFNIKDSSFKIHKTLPLTRIKKSDNSGTVDNNIVPDEHIGKGYPITYGTFSENAKALGYLTKQVYPEQIVRFSAPTNEAGNIVNNAFTNMYIWMGERFIRVFEETNADSADTEYDIDTDNDAATFNDTENNKCVEGELYLIYHAIPNLCPYDHDDLNFVDDEKNTIDTDLDTFGRITGVPNDEIDQGNLLYRLEQFDGFKGELFGLYLITKLGLREKDGETPEALPGGALVSMIGNNAEGYAATNTENLAADLSGTPVAEFDNMTPGSEVETTHDMVATPGIEAYDTFEKMRRGLLGIQMTSAGDGGGGSYMPDLRLYEIMLRMDFTIDFLHIPKKQFYADMAGLEFAAWIDEGARDNGKNATNLIDSPPYVIESIFRDELGLTTADIDWAEFDVLGNTTNGTLKDWKFAGQVIDDTDSAELIDMLCKSCMARNFKRADGSETLQGRPSLTDTIQQHFTTGKMWNVSQGRTPLSKIRNEFYVEYGYNPATKKCEKLKFVTASDHNFAAGGTGYQSQCYNSQTNYATTESLRIKAKWINDDATAELLCKALADYYTLRNYTCKFRTYPEFGFPLEINDTITIAHGWFPATVEGTTERWEIMKIQKSLTYVEIYAESRIDDF